MEGRIVSRSRLKFSLVELYGKSQVRTY